MAALPGGILQPFQIKYTLKKKIIPTVNPVNFPQNFFFSLRVSTYQPCRPVYPALPTGESYNPNSKLNTLTE